MGTRFRPDHFFSLVQLDLRGVDGCDCCESFMLMIKTIRGTCQVLLILFPRRTALVTLQQRCFLRYLYYATLHQNQSHDYSVIMTYIYYSYTKSNSSQSCIHVSILSNTNTPGFEFPNSNLEHWYQKAPEDVVLLLRTPQHHTYIF